jgi:hypothetical protein
MQQTEQKVLQFGHWFETYADNDLFVVISQTT